MPIVLCLSFLAPVLLKLLRWLVRCRSAETIAELCHGPSEKSPGGRLPERAWRSRWRGTMPSIATLEDLARALGASPAWLAFGEGPMELPRRGAKAAPVAPPGPP